MSSAFSLAGRLVLVTGGASGIGIGIAQVLAEAGAKVIIADIDAAGAQKQAAALIADGHDADWVNESGRAVRFRNRLGERDDFLPPRWADFAPTHFSSVKPFSALARSFSICFRTSSVIWPPFRAAIASRSFSTSGDVFPNSETTLERSSDS